MQEHGSRETAEARGNPDEGILRAQDRPAQRESEDAREDGVPEGTEEGASQEGLPQAAHAVLECRHVVADVLTPGKPEAHEAAQDRALRRALQDRARSQDQDEHTDALHTLFDDGTRHDRRHEVDGLTSQSAGLDCAVHVVVAEAGHD